MYQDQAMGKQAVGLGYASQANMNPTYVDAAARQSEVPEQMEILEKAISALGCVAEDLTNRLAPVRRQTGQLGEGKNAAAPEPVLCGMASGIRSQRQRVEGYVALLEKAARELEI